MVELAERDPEAQYLNVRVVGGEQPGATFSQKVGPLKIPGKVVGEDVKKLTAKDYKLQKIHVLLKVKDRKATCELNPTTAQLIVKALKEEREPKKKGVDKAPGLHNGSISLNDLFKIAVEIRSRSRSRTLRGTVKEVLGTCLSLGCFVEGKHPKEVIAAVNGGKAAVAELFEMMSEQDSLPSFLDE